MASAALDVTDLEVFYGATQVLHRVSLNVAAGEFVALLGPSGCGKTTLLRAVSGFVPVHAGKISVGGRDITHEPPDRRGMAMVFQSYALWPHMTTAQNLGYGLKLRRVAKPEIARRVAEILAMLKLEGFGERNVTEFMLEYQLAKFLRLETRFAPETSGVANRLTQRRVERAGVDLIFFFSY